VPSVHVGDSRAVDRNWTMEDATAAVVAVRRPTQTLLSCCCWLYFSVSRRSSEYNSCLGSRVIRA